MHNENLENLVVVKRSGQRVEFNASKVAIAIKKAFDSTGEQNEDKVFKTFEKVLKYINENYKERKTINVEDIQDIIEDTLYNEKYLNVYNSFKEYRNKRSISRKVFSEKQQHKFLKAIEKFEDDDFNNSNNSNPHELIYKFGKIIYSEYTKTYILDNKSLKAIDEGNIYIHNLDYFSLGILSNTHLKIKEYQNLDELINMLINAGKDINGEIGINNLDDIMYKYLLHEYHKIFKFNLKRLFKLFGFYEFINYRKLEELIDKEQDINFDLEKFDAFNFNDNIKNLFVNAYKFTEEEIINITKSILNKLLISLDNNKNLYTISFGTNNSCLGTLINTNLLNILSVNQYSNLNIVIKITQNNNFIASLPEILENNKKVFVQLVDDNNVEYFSNGCKIHFNSNGDEGSTGRMIVSDTSINLARLGLKYKNKPIENFYNELSSLCELAKNQMCLSFESIGNKTKENYQALFTGNILDDEKLESNQKIRKVIKNGVLSLGIIGLKECVINIEDNKIKQIKLINDILDYLNNLMEKYSQETKLNFGIFETTNKNARKSLLSTDKAIYGALENITDKKYYELIENDYIENYNELSKIRDKYSLGKLITFKLPSKFSNKKILDIINILQESNIDFAVIKVGKHED